MKNFQLFFTICLLIYPEFITASCSSSSVLSNVSAGQDVNEKPLSTKKKPHVLFENMSRYPEIAHYVDEGECIYFDGRVFDLRSGVNKTNSFIPGARFYAYCSKNKTIFSYASDALFITSCLDREVLEIPTEHHASCIGLVTRRMIAKRDGSGIILFYWVPECEIEIRDLQGNVVKHIRILDNRPELVHCLAVTKHANLFLLGTKNGLYSCDIYGRNSLLEKEGGVTAIALSKDDTQFIVGLKDGAEVWRIPNPYGLTSEPEDVEDFMKVLLIPSSTLISHFDHPGKVTSVQFSADEQRVLIGSDESVALWDIVSGKLIEVFEGRSPVAFSPDNTSILTGGPEGLLEWDL